MKCIRENRSLIGMKIMLLQNSKIFVNSINFVSTSWIANEFSYFILEFAENGSVTWYQMLYEAVGYD